MHEDCREAFRMVRDMANELAQELDCDVKVSRTGRSQTTHFELIPNGSAYGPTIRVNDLRMRDPLFVNRLIMDQPDKVRKEVKEILDRLEQMKLDPTFEN